MRSDTLIILGLRTVPRSLKQMDEILEALYEMYDKVPEINHRTIVGIDLGIKKLLTLSDGTTYDNNKYIDKYVKRIAML